MIKSTFRLANKPYERTILISLAEKYDCDFSYDEQTGFAVVSSQSKVFLYSIRAQFNEITSFAYRKLAFTQADNKFADVPIKTLNSEFMQGFTPTIVSVLTGNAVVFPAKTEAQRAGLMAAKEYYENG